MGLVEIRPEDCNSIDYTSKLDLNCVYLVKAYSACNACIIVDSKDICLK